MIKADGDDEDEHTDEVCRLSADKVIKENDCKSLNAARCILVNGSTPTPVSMKCLVGERGGGGDEGEGGGCGNEKD